MSERKWVYLRILGWMLNFSWYLLYEFNFWINLPVSMHQLSVLRGITGMLGTIFILTGFYKLEKQET